MLPNNNTVKFASGPVKYRSEILFSKHKIQLAGVKMKRVSALLFRFLLPAHCVVSYVYKRNSYFHSFPMHSANRKLRISASHSNFLIALLKINVVYNTKWKWPISILVWKFTWTMFSTLAKGPEGDFRQLPERRMMY